MHLLPGAVFIYGFLHRRCRKKYSGYRITKTKELHSVQLFLINKFTGIMNYNVKHQHISTLTYF
jgi:hypothetical protein